MLELGGLNAAYGDFRVLHDVAMTVRKGDLVALLGANAAGKTTTLRCISGLLPPLSGIVRWHGQDITHWSAEERARQGIIQVPEGRHLFGTMTVRENLELGAFSPRARRHMARNLELAEYIFPLLRERSSALAGSLSGGQQQMVAIARGLMAQPELLMLDEPSVGLAPLIIEEIMEALREINREGVTMLIVEQNVQKSLELASRGYVIESGRIVLEGTSDELLASDEVRRAYLGI